MHVRSATESDLDSMVDLAARLQVRPECHIAYLGVERVGILEELTAVDWRPISALAFDRDRLVAWLVGDCDAELGRVYWLGPFVEAAEWEQVAGDVYGTARNLLPRGISQEEFAIDARFDRLQRWATTVGFVAGPGSRAMRLGSDPGPTRREVRPVTTDDHATVGALHEELFPGTHTTGRRLVAGRDDSRSLLVTEVGGTVAGYVAVERQPDGSGYIDFLGVAVSFRRRGLGVELVRAGVAELRRIGADPIHLTVREDSAGARAMYSSLGFHDDRTIRPLRKGFSLP